MLPGGARSHQAPPERRAHPGRRRRVRAHGPCLRRDVRLRRWGRGHAGLRRETATALGRLRTGAPMTEASPIPPGAGRVTGAMGDLTAARRREEHQLTLAAPRRRYGWGASLLFA